MSSSRSVFRSTCRCSRSSRAIAVVASAWRLASEFVRGRIPGQCTSAARAYATNHCRGRLLLDRGPPRRGSKFKFRRFQGGSRAARRVKFPPANRSWRGAGGRDLRPKCHLPCSAEKLGELGDPGFQARLFWKRLWHFFLVADPPQGRQHVGKRWLFLLPVPRSEGKT